jgi:hypothetical protein
VRYFKAIQSESSKGSYFLLPHTTTRWMSKYRNSTGIMHDVDHLLSGDGRFGNECRPFVANEPAKGLFFRYSSAVVYQDTGDVGPTDASATGHCFDISEFNADT